MNQSNISLIENILNLVQTINVDMPKKGPQGMLNRLQLKRGLLGYGHHPQMHEMASGRSSRADFLTNLREISMRVFFNLKNVGKLQYGQKNTNM